MEYLDADVPPSSAEFAVSLVYFFWFGSDWRRTGDRAADEQHDCPGSHWECAESCYSVQVVSGHARRSRPESCSVGDLRKMQLCPRLSFLTRLRQHNRLKKVQLHLEKQFKGNVPPVAKILTASFGVSPVSALFVFLFCF